MTVDKSKSVIVVDDKDKVQKLQHMRAITLWRPWPAAMAHLGKRVENREWVSNLKEGEWIAIHAGKRWDASAPRWIRSNIPLEAQKDVVLDQSHDANKPGIVAIAKYSGYSRKSRSLWFTGAVGWEFSEVIALSEIIPTSGKRNVWTIEDSALVEIKHQLCKSKSCPNSTEILPR